MSEILHQLRFKQSRYKRYEGADKFPAYDMESHKDSELVVWLKGGRYRTVQ